jgi:hypothetical protein
MSYNQDSENNSDSSFDISSLFKTKEDEFHILHDYAKSLNLIDQLTDEVKQKLLNRLISGMDEDKTSMAHWLQNVEEAQKLAKLTKEPKNTPMANSANIKFPLITDACFQFAARTYPEVVQDGKLVKMEIVGTDADGKLALLAEQGALFMNYQLLGPDSEWEISLDKLLNVLANNGFVLKKTYFDPLKKKNVSDMCHFRDIYLRNDHSIQCLTDLRRITHILHCHPNDLIESARAGIYDEYCVEEVMKFYAEGTLNPHCDLYEVHCFADLDDDGYEEPYIVTIHKETNKLLRIVARYSKEDIELKDKKVLRINPIQYFTDYQFLPSPDGCFIGMGFGTLLLHMNETINTILNQLIDAGKLANLQTGFIDSRIHIMGGTTTCDPGQWNRVKGVIGQQLKDGIVPLDYKEPSTVLYQLLGMLIQASKELTSSTDIMQGAMEVQNAPATSMLAMVEQGMKRLSAIQKRFNRSLKEEYQKQFRLNGIYADPVEFANITGNPNISCKDVFSNKNLRVFPVADPNLASDAQRSAQAQVVGSLLGKPGINNAEVYMRILQAAKVPHPEKIAPPEMAQKANNAPDPAMMKVQSDNQIKGQQNQIKSRAQDLKEKEFAAKLAKIEAEITQMQANAVKLVAQAKSTQHHDVLDDHSLALDGVKAQMDATSQAHQQQTDASLASKSLQIDQQKADQQHEQAMTGHAINAQANQQQAEQAAQEAQNDQASPNNGVDQSSGNSGSDQGS